MQFRGGVLVWQGVNKIGYGLASAHHLADHAGGDIERIVIPIKIIGNKYMPRHFTSNRRINFSHAFFHMAVTCFPNLWIAAGVFNQIERHIG